MWLLENNYSDLAGLANRMALVKNEIEKRNNDIHSISPF
jgi:hypothetical protein